MAIKAGFQIDRMPAATTADSDPLDRGGAQLDRAAGEKIRFANLGADAACPRRYTG